MKKSELKILILEAYTEYEEDRRRTLNEGMLETAAQKIAVWLLRKLKKVSPETFEKINQAIQNKDKDAINAIFNDPKIKNIERTLTAGILREAKKDAGALQRILKFIKEQPVISTDIVLALIGTIIGLYFAHFDGLKFLDMIWPTMLKTISVGSVAGAGIKGSANLFKQYKTMGSPKYADWKGAAKDAAAGAGVGAMAGIAAGTLGGVGSGIAHGVGAVAGGITAKASDIVKALGKTRTGEDIFEAIYNYRNNSEFPHLQRRLKEIENWKKWIYDEGDALTPGNLEEKKYKEDLDLFLHGDENAGKRLAVRFKRLHGVENSS